MRAPILSVLASLLLVASAPLLAEDEPSPGPQIVSTGSVTLVVGEGRYPLATTTTTAGILFDLAPLVPLAEGTLAAGPLGQSWTLDVGETRAIFGLTSPTVAIGRRLVSLPQPPRAAETGVHVPIELLRECLGSPASLEFEWSEPTSTLTVARRASRDVPVTVEVVDLPGVTTLVVQFGTRVRVRPIDRVDGLRLEVRSDRLIPPASTPRSQGPFLQRLTITPTAIDVQTAPGTTATSYELDPQRFVIDLQHAPPQGAATPVATGSSAPPPTVIVLDPGHGGDETGALGPSGAREKDLVLMIAHSLERRLEERLGVRVILTREEDQNLGLDARSAIANQHQAALFISLHLNAAWGGRAKATGAETYFLSLAASDARAAESAALENRSDDGSATISTDPEVDDDLRMILWDLAQTHHLGESQRFARIVQEELDTTLGLRDRGVKQAPFRVLMGAAMPAVLVELGFISNPEEEARLLDPEYRSRLVDALVRAIQRFQDGGLREPGAP